MQYMSGSMNVTCIHRRCVDAGELYYNVPSQSSSSLSQLSLSLAGSESGVCGSPPGLGFISPRAGGVTLPGLSWVPGPCG